MVAYSGFALERWERNWMDLRDSPYRSLQWQVRLKLEVYGDRKALDNPYHWDRVEFNLPGSKGYRSDLPWVMKIQCDGHLAAKNFVYVDNGRATGHSPRLTWAAARAYAAGCSRRGVQDASRKRTSPSDTPGPWAGTVTHTTGGRVLGMVSQGKWDKTKLLIAELGDMIPKGPLPLQRLLEIRGFLMYVVRTYTWLNPYIKGLHLTVDSWRPGRAEDGFKWTAKERRWMQYHGTEEGGLPCRREFEGEEVLGTMDHAGTDEGAPGDPSRTLCSGFGLPARTHFERRAPKTTLPGRTAGRFLRDWRCQRQGKGERRCGAIWGGLRVGSVESRMEGEVFQLSGRQKSHGQIGALGSRWSPQKSRGFPHH